MSRGGVLNSVRGSGSPLGPQGLAHLLCPPPWHWLPPGPLGCPGEAGRAKASGSASQLLCLPWDLKKEPHLQRRAEQRCVSCLLSGVSLLLIRGPGLGIWLTNVASGQVACAQEAAGLTTQPTPSTESEVTPLQLTQTGTFFYHVNWMLLAFCENISEWIHVFQTIASYLCILY